MDARKLAESVLQLYQRLELLACPYIDNSDEAWMAELLLRPSETRINLLSWLILKIDNSLESILESDAPAISNRIDVRLQKLLLLFNLFGVCKVDDFDIVKGTASQKKQISFWELLVDMAIVANRYSPSTGEAQAGSMQSGFLVSSRPPTLSDAFCSSRKFVSVLVRENKMADLFSTEVHLFPPNVEKELGIDKTDSRPPIPKADTLIEVAEKMKADLDLCTRQLEDILGRHTYEPPDQARVERHCRSVDLALKTFSQTVDLFIHAYEEEIKVWCNKPKPTLSGLGPAVNSVHKLLCSHQELTKSLRTANQASAYLCTEVLPALKKREQREKDLNLHPVPEMLATVNELAASAQRRNSAP